MDTYLLLLLQSKATDFLDYKDEQNGEVYFIGVLDRHSVSNNFAVYYKVKEMISWITKNLEG